MPGLETLPSAGSRDQQMDRYSGKVNADADRHDQLDINWRAPDDARELVPAIPTPEQGIPVPDVKVNDDPIRIVLTSLDQNVDAFAREAAHEKLSKKAEKGPLWKRTAKSVWDNLTREYQIVKATGEARQDILAHQNLRHHQGKSDAQWREDTVMRYSSDYGEKLIREGETFHRLGSAEAASDPKAIRIREDITDLLRQRAKGEIIDDDSFEMMLDRTMEAWKAEGISQDFIGEGQLTAHNVGEMSDQVNAALDSAEGLSALDRDARLEEILANIEIVAGEARVGSQVEIDSTVSERIAEKLKGVSFLNEGRIARVASVVGNELFVAGVVSAAAYGARMSTLGQVAVPGLGAGVVAAVRERRSLIDERALMARRADAGLEIDPAKKAQVEMAAAQYESRPAGELIRLLGDLYTNEGDLNIRSREELDSAISLLAEVRARADLEYSHKARLINYADNSTDQLEGRKFDLAQAEAKLEEDLKKLFDNPAERGYLDVKSDEAFAQMFKDHQDIKRGQLLGEMNKADRRFNKLVAKRAFQKALTATIIGGAVGYAAREAGEAATNAYHAVFGNNAAPELSLASSATSMGPDHIGGQAGPDHIGTTTVSPDHIGTPVTGPDYIGSPAGPDHIGTSVGPENIGTQPEGPSHIGSPELLSGETMPISETSKVVLPEGFSVQADGDHVDITAPNGETYKDLTLNPDGSLSSEAEQALNNAGYNIVDHPETVLGTPEVTQTTVTAAEFANGHQQDMVNIHHTKWFDNNTSKFDLNELGTDTYKAGNGSVVVDIKSMTAGGSFHGASGVNWQEAAQDGHLKVFMSASQGTQAHAFEVTINPDGTATIDQDDPGYALFDEKGVFKGGFLEVALDGGEAPDGGTNIATLSTIVGENHEGTLTDTVTTPTYQTAHTYVIQPTKMEPQSFTTTVPTTGTPFTPVIPPVPRRRFGEGGVSEPSEAPARSPVEPEPFSEAPIRPTTSASPQHPPLMALPAAPSAGSAEAVGAAPGTASTVPEQGLPALEAPITPAIPARPTGSNETAEDAGGAESETTQQTPPNAGPETTRNDDQMLAKIDAVADAFPLLIPNGTRGYSERAMKLATLIYNQLKNERPREVGEDAASYQKRIMRRAMRATSPDINGSPGLKDLYKEAFQLFSQATARSQSSQNYDANTGKRVA